MNANSEIKFLADLIFSSSFEFDGSYLKVKSVQQSLHQQCVDALGAIGYLKADEAFEEDSLCFSRNGSDFWKNGLSPFYDSLEVFWNRIRSSGSVPALFCIFDEEITSADVHPADVLAKIELVFAWKDVLHLLSDHQENVYGKSRLIYFINTEKGGKKYDLFADASLTEIRSFEDAALVKKCVDDFKNHIGVEDAHANERREVMRAALADMLDEIDAEQNRFVEIVNQGAKFWEKYQEQYQLYVHRFSVNKLLAEIDEKSLEYAGKINDFVSTSQNKAFTIPGALVAAAALIKSGTVVEYFLIFIGLLLFRSIIYSWNEIYCQSFDNLERNLDRAFGKYKKMNIEAEVRSSAEDSREQIMGLIASARNKLAKLEDWANCTLFGALVYILVHIFLVH